MGRRSFRTDGEPRTYTRGELDMMPSGANLVFEVDGESFRVAKASDGSSAWHLRSRRPLDAEFLSQRPLRRAYARGTEPSPGSESG